MKRVFKIITSVLVMSLLMLGTSIPAVSAAKPAESKITLGEKEYTLPELIKESGDSKQSTAAASAFTLKDDQPLALTLYQTMPFATINVSDSDTRYLTISSGTPLKTTLKPVNTAYQGFIGYNSVDVRPFNMIQTHFIPGLDYELFVFPETYPATITVSMSKSGSNASWVYSNTTTTFTEKNMLMGGQTDTYGLAFKTPGTYLYTITSPIQLQLNYIDAFDSNNNKLGRTIYPGVPFSFYTYIQNTGYAQNNYGIYLYNPGSPSTGGAYTITVQK